jgi:hypothetical protein
LDGVVMGRRRRLLIQPWRFSVLCFSVSALLFLTHVIRLFFFCFFGGTGV